ncbi:MAG: nitric oxide reductase activation protein NorD [Candidatus Binatia bacterium]
MEEKESHSAAELDRIGEVLRLYTKALSGQEIRIVPRGGASARGAGWVMPSDDGKAVSVKLPPKIDRFPSQRENFGWYKVILTHQAGHIEFGTFQFGFARPSQLFTDWRSGLAEKNTNSNGESDFQKLRRLFPDPIVGMAIFECIEDTRIDAHVLARYPGIRPTYRQVALQVLSERPRLGALPLREALIEGLVQAGLGGSPLSQASEGLRPALESALGVFSRVNSPRATVEDSAEAALRIYQLAAQLPNVAADDECDHEHEHEHRHADDDTMPDELEESAQHPQEVPFKPPREVEFRLDMDLQATDQPQDDRDAEEGNEPEVSNPEGDGPLKRDEPFCYLYPEWDFRSAAFKDRWCRVRERVMEEGTSDFYTETLTEYRWLVNQVRSRFEHFLPELFRKVTRRYDGEDVDIDSLIDMVVDCQAGTTPSEKIYWRRERTQRDVAVALLLDISATTNEYIQLEAAQAIRPTGTNAHAYSAYLRQIAAGIDERGKPLRKRAIDIEKQAVIVLIQALENIGDSYAVYAFSGSGRGNVEFHVVKDFAEVLNQRVARRVDRLAPAHATRMGAAIRHAVRKLERVEAQTRLLFLVSDGRPYDRDYGRDPEDQQYAVHDTREALREAVRRKIRPFCLTIDRDGGDYMRAMCDDLPYEVVDRVEDLPISLITAYPKLTA